MVNIHLVMCCWNWYIWTGAVQCDRSVTSAQVDFLQSCRGWGEARRGSRKELGNDFVRLFHCCEQIAELLQKVRRLEYLADFVLLILAATTNLLLISGYYFTWWWFLTVFPVIPQLEKVTRLLPGYYPPLHCNLLLAFAANDSYRSIHASRMMIWPLVMKVERL